MFIKYDSFTIDAFVLTIRRYRCDIMLFNFCTTFTQLAIIIT